MIYKRHCKFLTTGSIADAPHPPLGSLCYDYGWGTHVRGSSSIGQTATTFGTTYCAQIADFWLFTPLHTMQYEFQLLSWLYTYHFSRFRHARELFREIANQLLYTFHNFADFGHLWFCEKLDEKPALSSSLTCPESIDRLARMAKCKMRRMIGEMVYEMPSIHFSFLSFRQHFFRSRQFDNKCIVGFTGEPHQMCGRRTEFATWWITWHKDEWERLLLE